VELLADPHDEELSLEGKKFQVTIQYSKYHQSEFHAYTRTKVATPSVTVFIV
jgi:hypothetical protein